MEKKTVLYTLNITSTSCYVSQFINLTREELTDKINDVLSVLPKVEVNSVVQSDVLIEQADIK